MESLFFRSDDCLKLLLECGADYTKVDSYGDPFLHDVAIYGGLRTIEIVHTVELKDIDIYATNRYGKTALEIAWNWQDKPDGFGEASKFKGSVPNRPNSVMEILWINHLAYKARNQKISGLMRQQHNFHDRHLRQLV